MLEKVKKLKEKLGVTIAAHYYQKKEIVKLADLLGDSLALAKKTAGIDNPLIFCGVKFMGESAKILNPSIDVYMPKLADCSMARMAQEHSVKNDIKLLKENGIDFIPVLYINSTAKTKALIAKEGGITCTSSNAEKIVKHLLSKNKKIFFLPDKNLGTNIALKLGLFSKIIGEKEWQKADIICFNGHCSVHQLFMPEHIDFYREKFPDIKIAVHPECSPEVVKKADFAGSTSQILEYVKENRDKKIAIGTEINFINWIKENINPNVYVLSSTKPECPSMNETTLKDLYTLLKAIDEGKGYNKIEVEEDTAQNAKKALERMMQLS